MRTLARLVTAVCGLTLGLGGASAPAQSSHRPSSSSPALPLEVPYLSQSVLLCGGAALAMVERWWGRRGVYAEDFAELVRPALGGILTTELAASAVDRGWDTRVQQGTPEQIRRQLAAGEPVITLIEAGTDRYHYVVLLAWHDGKVTYHDPARAPFITVDESRFLSRWSAADRWAMVIRPFAAAPVGPAARTDAAVPFDSLPCAPWLDRAVDAVEAGRLDEAATLLGRAREECPSEPRVLRELAGVRFKQSRYADAITLTREYLALAPADQAGWQLLASSLYLAGDRDGALDAWNELGTPRVDLVRIDGARGIRFMKLAAAVATPPVTVLTPARLALARRRLGAFPAVERASVGYQPVAGGLVEVRVAVRARPVVERSWPFIAAGAIRAVARHEARLDIASPTGAGELWTGAWRWESSRPRISGRVATPFTLGFPGVLEIEGAWEQFLGGSGETRRSGQLGFGGWITGILRPSAAVRFERWSADRDYLAVALATEARGWRDRLAVTARAEQAVATSAHPSYRRAGARGVWASSPGLSRPAWSGRLGYDWASRFAPQGTWAIAGDDLSWAIPLRAHPLETRGADVGNTTGRALLHGGLAGDVPLRHMGFLAIAAGVFLDAAHVSGAAGGAESRWYLDGGAGIRLGIADGALGVIRIDWAASFMTDRRRALTVGIHRSWPLFELVP